MQAELLAPAGDFATALAAFDAGADAVYCGLAEYSARAYANNLSIDELRLLMRVAKAKAKKVYVAFNTLVEESELDGAVRQLALIEDAGADAIIVQDLGIARIARAMFPRLALHASTQLVAHNLEGVLALKELGFSRVVLARELSLAEVESIAKRCGIEIECFIHGALCYSLSGLCLYSALEKGRSGNRGKCAYCCRLAHDDGKGGKTYPFSMKDLRLGKDALRLVDAGVKSLKIEGRMKSPLYVASVVKYYRQILDGTKGVTLADLETVFSRRTTKLYLDGAPEESPIDPSSLGHLGAEIGVVKRVTKDRRGDAYIRFHTMRALEKHDGLQFAAKEGGKPRGFGIGEMRRAISRAPVFEVAAGADVEVMLPEGFEVEPGEKIYCSMSNAVKKMFPAASIRPDDYPGIRAIDVEVSISRGEVAANGVSVKGDFAKAENPGRTFDAAKKAFSKLGGTDYSLAGFKVDDPEGLFVPVSVLNELRRALVKKLDDERARAIEEKIASYREKTIPGSGEAAAFPAMEGREALPLYTGELKYPRLRAKVKGLVREGRMKWQVSDLAGLRLLKSLGMTDIVGDWPCYAFNSAAIAAWRELGLKGLTASPENSPENKEFLAHSGFPFAFAAKESMPLFISLTEPAPYESDEIATRKEGDLWITTRRLK